MFEKIKENGNKYIIKGFPLQSFSAKLKKKYKTTRLSHLFEAIGFSFTSNKTISIHKFFIPELIFLLRSFNYPNSLINLIIDNTWLNDMYKEVHNRVNLNLIAKEMLCKALNYQKEFIQQYDILRQLYQLNGYLLSFDQGLGKTLTSLMLMIALRKRKVIIVAPNNTLQSVWVNHIEQWFKTKKRIFVVNTNLKLDLSYDFYIFNYESMKKMEPLIQQLKNYDIEDVGVIVDESHNFLRLQSNMTQNLINLRNELGVKDMLLMSGTPLKNAGVEILPMLFVLDRFFDEEAAIIFKKAFGLNTNIGTDILRARLDGMMHRKLKTEVVNLPKKTEEVHKIVLPNGKDFAAESIKKGMEIFIKERQQYHMSKRHEYESEYYFVLNWLERQPQFMNDPEFKFYVNTVEDFQTHTISLMNPDTAELVRRINEYEKQVIVPALPKELKKKFNDNKTAVKYINLKIQGEVIGSFLSKKRIAMTTAMIAAGDLKGIVEESIKKTVVFTSYVDTIETCVKYFDDNNFRSIAAYGKTSNDVKSIINKFQNDPTINPLIASLLMMSTGVTLTAASTIVMLNRPDRDATFRQASSRIHRLGQDTDCRVITFELDTGEEPNLSTRMRDILAASKSFFDAVVEVDS